MRACLIIRHAIAEDREVFARTGRPDGERPLTDFGRRRMEGAARGIARLAPEVARVLTSPWTRARETAEIVAGAYDDPPVSASTLLLPGADPDALLAWVFGRAHPGLSALVGHEPALSEWIGWAATGKALSLVDMKKGGACLLAFPQKPAPGTGVIQWLAPPKLLRGMGRKGGKG
jgi:phosphohistidine phosphatase